MDYTLQNTAQQIDLAISGAYQALVVAGTGLFRYVSPPTGTSSPGTKWYDASVSGNYFFVATGDNSWGRITLSTF